MGGRAATPAASCRNCLRGSFTAPPPKKRGLQTPGGPQNSYRFDFQYCEPADGTRAATEKGTSARPAGSSALRYANHAIGGSGRVGCLSSLCRSWHECDIARSQMDVRFSNRPFRVKRFQTIHQYSVDVAHGLVLLFGIGTRGPSIMGFEDEAEQSIGRPCRQTNGRSKQTCELTSSIVPRGTSFHRSVELECPFIGLDAARFSCCCCGLFSGPAELGAVNPYAVHDHSQPACQGHDRLFHPAAPGDLHRPGFEPGPFLRPQHALSCFVEHDPHHLISAA